MLGTLLRCRAGLANRCAELIEFALRTVQLAIDNLQTRSGGIGLRLGGLSGSVAISCSEAANATPVPHT